MASKVKKHRRREATVSVADKIPLVSVIIPMYNSAKFIPQTLESLCYQTMKDFEVVIVDDCSTDNSVEVVENFANHVGGGLKLHVIKLPKNTGMPYLPRNVAINFARGKYLAFLDNDDLFTKTALEELTTLAEEYQADIVNMLKNFQVEDTFSDMDELINPANHKIFTYGGWKNLELNKVIEFTVDNFAERLNLWLNYKFAKATWNSFCKRDFWVSNQINFPYMPVSDDTVASFTCLCFAKKLLIVPNVVYIQRERTDSISRENDDVEKFIHKWLSNIIFGFKAFDETMRRVSFFSEHPDYRYAILEWWFNNGIWDAKRFPEIYMKTHPALLEQLAEKEFHSDDATLSAYLFNTVNIYRLQLMQLQQENFALKKELQKYQTAK